MTRPSFSIGVDLGQRRHYSAIAVAERVADPNQDDCVVRFLERMPLGTPYTAAVDRVVRVAGNPDLGRDCRLVVDATGLGMAVVDMFRAARPGRPMIAVWITRGQAERFDGKLLRVPNLELMARLQNLLETRRLRIARGMREAGTLVRELVSMRGVSGASGRIRVGAEGAGEHDDLALAVALAVWKEERRGRAGEGGGRLPGI